MKNSIWDILTGIVLFAILLVIIGFGVVVMNPGLFGLSRGQPSAPVELVPTIALPTDTKAPPAPPPTWTPTTAPTQAGESAARPTLRPSSTPLPTSTPVVLPTFTPTKKVTLRPTGGGISGGNCSVVYQNPADGTVMTPGQDFTTRWTLKNNSATTWANDSIDLKVIGGDRMHIGADLRDLPYSVGSGGMIDILIDMEAPNGKGTYTENWGLYQGSKSVCQFFVTIEVK